MKRTEGFSWLKGFELDYRSLSLFRICFGLCLFVDVFYRLFYVNEFYTDGGVMPRDAVISKFLNVWESSLFLINGQPAHMYALLTILLLAIIAFTVGYFTRVAAFVCWILMFSLHARNQVILHGGDDVIRTLLFWCQLVPLNVHFSLDKYLNAAPKKTSDGLLSWGGAGLMLQLLFIYFFTALLKWHPIWHTEGSAVYYALSLDQFTSSLGQFLLGFPEVMKAMTFSTLVLEFFGPLLVVLPWRTGWVRLIVALSFIGFHFGLFLTMELGPFPWTCMSAWLMIMPKEFWQKMPQPQRGPIQRLVKVAQRFSWRPPTPLFRFSGFHNVVAAVFIAVVCYWNMTQLDFLKLEKSKVMRIVVNVTETYQRWSMFAPYPRKDDGWYVLDGTLLDGTKTDPFRDDVVSFDKPENVAATFKNSMWRKYLTNIWLKSYSEYRIHFGRYLCRSWNARATSQEKRLNTVFVYYMVEMTPLPGEPLPTPQRELIWRHYCFDKPADWED